MLDSSDSNRPERRSALIAHELSRLNIDIAALSEVRFPEEGSLKEQGAGYTLYWSGRPAGERRLSGVGFMVRNSIASKLETLPTGHSDRIISMSHCSVSTHQLCKQTPLKKTSFIPIYLVSCRTPLLMIKW